MTLINYHIYGNRATDLHIFAIETRQELAARGINKNFVQKVENNKYVIAFEAIKVTDNGNMVAYFCKRQDGIAWIEHDGTREYTWLPTPKIMADRIRSFE